MLTTLSLLAHAAPHGMVRANIGAPNLVGGQAEIFIGEHWSVEVGGGGGLLPPSITLGGRWSPEATCWGCWTEHGLRLSPGLAVYAFPSMLGEGLASLNADLSYLWTSPAGVGVTVGARLGFGAAFGSANGRVKLEPGGEAIPLQLGIVF